MKKLVMIFACALVLSACGSDDDTPLNPMDPTSTPTKAPTSSASTKAPATEEPEIETPVVQIEIKDGKVTPQGDRVDVKAGDIVTLIVTTDEADEIHVHSEPEHSFDVEPGVSQEFTFTLKTPGQVAVESHHLDVTIVQLVVRP